MGRVESYEPAPLVASVAMAKEASVLPAPQETTQVPPSRRTWHLLPSTPPPGGSFYSWGCGSYTQGTITFNNDGTGPSQSGAELSRSAT